MIFPYLSLPTSRPIPSLGGARVRYRPILAVQLLAPLASRLFDGSVDCAADDTIFPRALARRLGIDLSQALPGEAQVVGGLSVPFVYCPVTLRVTDGLESCEWSATVGFADLPMLWALPGQAGFLEFFDAELRGARRELVLTPNTSFPGQHIVHRSASP